MLARIDPAAFGRVICLSRRPAPPGSPHAWLQGGLADADVYRPHLGPDVSVLHLAAATGRAGAREHDAVNRAGTAALLAACAAAGGARRFVLASSIAATFPDDPRYHYARSKRAAEALVRSSGLPWAIVRPTIVAAADAPAWRRLVSLALAPVPCIIGSGLARVQPVWVDDVADALVAAVTGPLADGRACDLGGPETLTMLDLMRRMRAAGRGRPAGTFLHLPYGALRAALVALGGLLGPASPVGAGQLTAFVADSVGTSNPLWTDRQGAMLGVDAMIARTLGHG